MGARTERVGGRTGRAGGRRLRAAALVGVVGLSPLAGCASGGDDDEGRRVLTVFAAASLSGAFTEIAADFEAATPGVSVRLSVDGSRGLADQIVGGAPADVFASADVHTMDRVASAGLLVGEPVPFATNVLTLITPPGNPAGVSGLDSSLDGVRLVTCADGVPCGSAARELAGAAGVELRPVSEESAVTDVRGKVTSGEADAGIVYVTDALAVADAVEQIPIAGADTAATVYPIGVLDRATDPGLAQRFVDAVTGPAGREVLAAYGFGAP